MTRKRTARPTKASPTKVAKAKKALEGARVEFARAQLADKQLTPHHYEMRRLIRALCGEAYADATAPYREAVQAVAEFQTSGKLLDAAAWLDKRLEEDGVNKLNRIKVFAVAVDMIEAHAVRI